MSTGKINFWKDRENKILNPQIFSTTAEQMAKDIANEGRGRINKGTQLRKFFDEVVRLNQLSKTNSQKWENILPQIHMLSAQAAYSHGRGHIGEKFLSIIKDNVVDVETPGDLDAFKNFFEAFLGFYKIVGRD